MPLEGRSALVTGAGRGIGAAIAKGLAAEGAQVVLCGRSEMPESVAAEIRSAGGRATALRGDLREESFAKQVIQTCRKEHGRLDVLINNAGVMKTGMLGMTPASVIREMFEVNILALMTLTQYAVRIMEDGRQPSIVNLASFAGVRGSEGLSAYSATKGAVIAFTLALARELGPRGIRVNAIAPGMIDTELLDVLGPDRAARVAQIPLGRLGDPDDVAQAALFLASDRSRYITGQVLGVDGGMRG